MRKKLRLLLLLLSCSVVLTAAPIRIGVEINTPPLSYVDENGQPAGFSAELLQAMQQVSPIEVQVVPGYWTNLLELFAAGKIDALANTAIREERRATMDFSIAHAYVHGLAYYPKGSKPIRSTRDFAGKTIGALSGSIGYANAIAHGGWGAKIIAYNTSAAALDAVTRGECDAALLIRQMDNTPIIEQRGMKWSFVEDIVHEYHFAVHKGDARTLEQINEALATVRSNGTFDRLYAKWIGPLEPHPIRWADLRPYYLPGILGLLVVLAIIMWQRHMMERLSLQAAQLRQSEERWKFALEGSGDGVWDWDVAQHTVHRSKRWKEMLGYRDDEIGIDPDEWASHVHPDDIPAASVTQQAHNAGEADSFSFEHRIKCKDGSWKWILSRGMAVRRDDEGKPLRVIGTHTDLTAIKQAEEDRLIIGKLESTGVLAGGIAHDFNNLLTVILLNLDLARYSQNSASAMLPHVEAAEKAALAARSLTHQLITFARGGATLPRITDVGGLLKDSVPLVLSGSNVRAEVQVDADLWTAEVDAGQVGQIFRNLVLNAREAMPDGGVVTLRASNVSLSAGMITGLAAGDYLHITVSDRGEGISPELARKIFDPYFSTKQRGPQKGMGLGLTICHSVAVKHRGAITVESALGVGTTFHVYLPAMKARRPDRGHSTPPLPGNAAISRRILVMDDELTIRESLWLTLEKMGHTVETVADGKEAVEAYRRAVNEGRPFEIVLLDLTIPGGMGGYETMNKLREFDPKVRALVMSGYTDDEVLGDCQKIGFKGVLHKPFTSDDLKTMIEHAASAED